MLSITLDVLWWTLHKWITTGISLSSEHNVKVPVVFSGIACLMLSVCSQFDVSTLNISIWFSLYTIKWLSQYAAYNQTHVINRIGTTTWLSMTRNTHWLPTELTDTWFPYRGIYGPANLRTQLMFETRVDIRRDSTRWQARHPQLDIIRNSCLDCPDELELRREIKENNHARI